MAKKFKLNIKQADGTFVEYKLDINTDDIKSSDGSKSLTQVLSTYSTTDHTHNYAGSSTPGGAATSANKVNSSLTMKLNGGTTEGTNQFTFNGSAGKTVNITPDNIGAAKASHGNHVPATETANNAKFLRNDNTWQTVTPANIGASPSGHNHDDRYFTESEINTKVNTINSNVTAAQQQADKGVADAAAAKAIADQAVLDAAAAQQASNKVKNSMKVQLNGGTTEGTNQFTFDGSAAKNINITPDSIGAAPASHGTHLTLGTGSGNAFRGDYGNTAYNHSQAAHAPSNAQKNSDITKAEIEAKLTGDITTHNHDGRYYTESEINTKINTINSNVTAAQTQADKGVADAAAAKAIADQAVLDAAAAQNNALASAKSYTDTAISNLVGGAPDAMNTLKELAGAIDAHQDVYEAYVAEVSTALEGKAPTSHGTHVTWATNAPKANGTAAMGTVARVAREDHVHPLQTTVSGNAGSANKVNNAMKVQLNGGTTEGTNQFTFDGSAAKTVNITPDSIGAAAASHGTHLTLGTGSSNAFRGDYGNTAYTHSQAAHAPSNAQKNSDITKEEIEAKLTGDITSHTHATVPVVTTAQIDSAINDVFGE